MMPGWLSAVLLYGGVTLLIVLSTLAVFYVIVRWGEDIGDWVCKPADRIEAAAKRHRRKSLERRGITDE